MVKIGQLCVKIAGRDAGKECLIIKDLKESYVMIDGLTRRRKCSLKHLEMFPSIAKIKENADHKEVIDALKGLGVELREKKSVKKDKPKKLKILRQKEKKTKSKNK